MLAVDWVGLAVTAGLLALILRGRRRVGRVGLALLLGELGRVGLVLLVGGVLAGMTLGGAFTRVYQDAVPDLLIRLGGILAAVPLARLCGRQVARDALLYAGLCGAVILWLPG